MSYEGSMKGSGIYSEDVTLEVECGECGKSWEEDFMTDDWGNVSSEVKCECGNAWTFEKEQGEIGDPNAPDTLEELWGE
jgi:hypothetical protein